MSLSVLTNKNEKQLITNIEVKKNNIILTLNGKISPTPSKHSLQIDKNKHLYIPTEQLEQGKCKWAFLNHSCSPNTFIKEQQLVAIEHISKGSELTFDYNTTEYDMATPFKCNCQKENCQKEIKGYRYLSNSKKEAIKPYAAPYLKAFISQ